ncbi:MAG: hypothetical protein WC322_03075 [Candidatus Paceibacterota bacterium]|jgi:hypothetical protein
MTREFSVIRRRPGILDIITPRRTGVDGYRIEWAANFDVAFTTLVTSSINGYVDDSLRDMAHAIAAGNNVRIIVNPADHTITDTKPFWLRFVPVVGGVPGTPGNSGLILPDASGRAVCVIAGNAPNAATITGSIQLDFPRLVEDLRIVNNGSNSLFVAPVDSDAEFEIKSGGTQIPFTNLRGAIPGIRVRGGGAVVAFQATFTLAFAR